MSLVQRVRIGVFALIAVGSVIIAGVQYVGIPERYLGQSYEIAVNLPESGGIFPNAEVTLRGVPVGRVSSLDLTPDGVRAELRLEKDVRIPATTLVRVAHLSAVGEQYVELLPPDDQGPFLAEGESLPIAAATTPLRVTSLLVHLNQLATSIGKDKLRRVVRELGLAFNRSGQDLATVLVRARELSATFSEVQPRTDRLLEDGRTVLATQRDLDPDLRRLTRGLDELTATIAEADPDIAAILREGPTTLGEVRTLLAENQSNVSVLLGNLLSVGEILAEPIRLRSLNTQLVMLPRIIQGTFNIQPGDGYARLGAVIDTSQAVCTRGYESSGTPPTQGTRLSETPGNPELRGNVNAFCAEPPSSGIGVRGAANVPRPAGDDTARVVARPNPRGFGVDSSFSNDGTGAGSERTDGVAPASTRMIDPTNLAGLLLKEDLG